MDYIGDPMNTTHSVSISWAFRSAVSFLFLGVAIGCASPPTLNFGGKSPTTFDGPASNWPLQPLHAEKLMHEAPMAIVSEEYAGAGITGALRVKARYPGEDELITLKWKTMPIKLDGINNSPRREIASYQLQFIFLEPDDFLVPPSVARCLIPETFADPAPHLSKVFPNTSCELGILSLWLNEVTIPRPLYDEARFLSDLTYARYLANFNLLTYLIRHRDGRDGNFLVAKDPSRPITFAIDNGMTFGGFFYNWFVDNWDDIKVPALPRESIDRLRQISKRDIKKLGVVAELHLDSDGVYRSVDPGENLGRKEGVRRRPGIIQFGLTKDEIEDVVERIEDLLEDVDDGKITLF